EVLQVLRRVLRLVKVEQARPLALLKPNHVLVQVQAHVDVRPIDLLGREVEDVAGLGLVLQLDACLGWVEASSRPLRQRLAEKYEVDTGRELGVGYAAPGTPVDGR